MSGLWLRSVLVHPGTGRNLFLHMTVGQADRLRGTIQDLDLRISDQVRWAFIRDFARPDVQSFQLETHDDGLPVVAKGSASSDYMRSRHVGESASSAASAEEPPWQGLRGAAARAARRARRALRTVRTVAASTEHLWKTLRHPEKMRRPSRLRTIPLDPQLPRRAWVEPGLLPGHEAHTVQQPPRHIFQAAEPFPQRSRAFQGVELPRATITVLVG